ncbi:hypothetical protein LHJ74_20870 [Streptomyces sp. N2-109]|uniref:Uncharacterized protein n=1 Tax=Streptomyces gossypii TaxID=2883101 RepID=A0ABT2JWS1_9ACTN|nr:hypothetical protein [Streptomyces gossypii]MCT2592326.1 hypothetical protein [Streptomyces gossypii]
MAHVEMTPAHLVIRLQAAQRAFGRRRPLVIPWPHVHRAYADEQAARAHPGARWGVASNVPGVVTLGSFRRSGRRDFWAVRDPRKAIVIELTDEKYDRLLVEVTHPEATLTAIASARTGDQSAR